MREAGDEGPHRRTKACSHHNVAQEMGTHDDAAAGYQRGPDKHTNPVNTVLVARIVKPESQVGGAGKAKGIGRMAAEKAKQMAGNTIRESYAVGNHPGIVAGAQPFHAVLYGIAALVDAHHHENAGQKDGQAFFPAQFLKQEDG